MSNVIAVQSLGAGQRERQRFDRDSARSFAQFRRYIAAWIFAIAGLVAVVLPGILWLARYGTDLVIGGTEHTFQKGDRYFIPEGVTHSANIYAGYADITFFDAVDRYRPK